MGKNKQLAINLITTFSVLLINIFINFGLSKYIVESIGEDAYGFISLANTFISYATIFTVALNSMASRFITIDIHKGNKESASKYFSSILIANIVIVVLLIIPAIVLIGYIEHIIKVPINILMDVKLLFSFIFINFFVSLIGGVFTVATYCTNKIYLSSLKNMESIILKALVVICLFILLRPKVFYVGFATLIASIYVLFWNIHFTKKLLPDIKIQKNNFCKEKIKVLLASGMWNSLTNLGNVLADGLDLLISNIVIDPSTMGVVALSKVPSNVLNTVINSITNVFQPQVIQYYAKDDIEGAVLETEKGMKISGTFGNIPFAYIIIFGTFFCSVWMPKIDNNLLYILCIITFINVFSGAIVGPLYNIFTITNYVKWNAVLNIFSGVLSTVIVVILIKTTNLGVYAIVGVSAIVGLIKGLLIIPIYASKCLKTPPKIFLRTIFRYVLTTIIMTILFYLLRIIYHPNTWVKLFVSILICGILGLIINGILLLDKHDRQSFIEIVRKKIRGIK